jgi:hypothetical protein
VRSRGYVGDAGGDARDATTTPRAGKLKLGDIKELFHQMRHEA